MAAGTVVVGSAATVREKIERVREQTGFDILITLLQFASCLTRWRGATWNCSRRSDAKLR